MPDPCLSSGCLWACPHGPDRRAHARGRIPPHQNPANPLARRLATARRTKTPDAANGRRPRWG
eukprot:6510353-Lingulodinium_polyedra.AAC.1